MMFIVSLIEFSKRVQNEISAKVMPKPQNFTADFAGEMKLSKATVSRLAKMGHDELLMNSLKRL